MTTYRVGIAHRPGAVDGWVLDLPGCRAIGSDRDEVIALLPAVIAEHLVWLRRHAETEADPADAGFEVVEEVETAADFAFDADKEPLSVEALETGIRRSQHAFADLSAYVSLPDTLLDWRVQPTAVKIDANYPDVRSIREMLAHASGSSGFFGRNVGDAPWTAPAVASPSDVPALREAVFGRLRALTADELAKVYRRDEREWTARKLVRRLINHERFHTKEIEQRLAWLLLAVPDVMPASRE